MPKLAANLSTLFNEVDFLDRFEAASKAGFSGVEYLFPYDYPADEIAKRLRDNGLKQVLFDTPSGNWQEGERGIACMPLRQAEFRAGARQALEYAAALDCQQITVLAGIVEASAEHDYERFVHTLVDNLTYVADLARPAGVTVLVETLNTKYDAPNYYIDTMARLDQIVTRVERPNVAMQFDVYHVQAMEGDLSNKLRQYFSQIRHIQIADMPGRGEPGTGEINYPHLLELCDELGYEGWVGCEYIPTQNTAESLKWAKKWLKN